LYILPEDGHRAETCSGYRNKIKTNISKILLARDGAFKKPS
jgi:hypothetical protein